MARLRRPTSMLVAAVLSAGLLTTVAPLAGAAPVATAPAATTDAARATGDDDGVQVAELDLSGVDPAAAAALPAPESVPTEEGATPPADYAGAAAQLAAPEDAAEPNAEPAAEPTADPTADPTAQPTAVPSGQPTDQATDQPTDQPSDQPTAAPTDQPAPADGTAAEPDVLTVPMDTQPFTVLGVTWDRSPDLSGVQIRYRVHSGGEWSDWAGAEAADVAPDADRQDAAQADDRDGTDPIVAVDSDGVQIWAQAETGTVTNLKAVLVDPGTDPATVGQTATPESSAAVVQNTGGTATSGVVQNLGTSAAGTVRTAAVAQPTIVSRAGWGADESMRTCDPDMSNQMVSAAVHHTASTNDYAASQVPGILRGFYAYHTRPEAAGGRGWCDIGYNFLVDKFGTIYEGRAGGIDTTTVGVHTGGFNSRTIGIAAIGDYSTVAPSAALLESLSQLIAWKFTVHRILANTNVQMVSGGGASKYPAGTVVTFPTIYAHRDAQLTSCPGQTLYDRLGDIRNRVAVLANATVQASPISGLETFRGTPSGVQVAGWTYDPNTDAATQVQVLVNGVPTRIAADRSRPDVAAAHGVGPNHGFAGTVPAPNGRNLVCVSAVNLGEGRDVVLACDWLTVQNATPIGGYEAATATTSSITVAGWALDPDTTDPIDVHIYVNGTMTKAVTANLERPDIAAVYGKGSRHGFSTTLPATGGTYQVCVFAINKPTGTNPTLGCRSVQVGNVPFGSIDAISTTPNSLTVRGWAIDRDTTDPVQIHLYIDGAYSTAVRADQSRPDVGTAYGLGDNRGYTVSATVANGSHQVCVYAINVPNGNHPQLGCRTVTVTNAAPLGNIDVATGDATGIRVAGWALDPDTTAPIQAHLYLDGAMARAVTADATRNDIAQAFGKGAAHGFDVRLPAAEGVHEVCLWPINTPKGSNPRVACRTVTVANAAPIGSIDVARGTATGIEVAGWAVDTDTSGAVQVHPYVDGVYAGGFMADQSRPDVGRALGVGSNHGFRTTIPAAAGQHEVCLFAINQPVGNNPRLGCRTVTTG